MRKMTAEELERIERRMTSRLRRSKTICPKQQDTMHLRVALQSLCVRRLCPEKDNRDCASRESFPTGEDFASGVPRFGQHPIAAATFDHDFLMPVL
jgi:hypothetical protein